MVTRENYLKTSYFFDKIRQNIIYSDLSLTAYLEVLSGKKSTWPLFSIILRLLEFNFCITLNFLVNMPHAIRQPSRSKCSAAKFSLMMSICHATSPPPCSRRHFGLLIQRPRIVKVPSLSSIWQHLIMECCWRCLSLWPSFNAKLIMACFILVGY